jgi:dihydroorotate dehydrogenase (NAD+) catalytic subunit
MGRTGTSLSVNIAGISLSTPVLPASGTFGYGDELVETLDYAYIGAIVTKTITMRPRQGNPQPRIWELESGLINSIGLQNIGAERFKKEKLPSLKKIGKPVIVSVGGESKEEILGTLEYLCSDAVAAFELNLSCPNLGTGRIVAEDAKAVSDVVATARSMTDIPIIVKLSPNVSDMVEIGVAAQKSGADALCVANTYKGLFFDRKMNKFHSGGISGDMIFPMTLRHVYDLYPHIDIPIIGLGGINSGERALEMFFAGSSAVAIGTGLALNPGLPMEICRFLEEYLALNGIRSVSKLTGSRNEKKETAV